jgi:hypothetical protein
LRASAAGSRRCRTQRLHHLEADGERRVERHHRFLEHHADVAAADAAQLLFGSSREILALEDDASRLEARDRRQQAQHRAPDHGLAAARFAHQRQHLSGLDRETHFVDHALQRPVGLADADR